MRAYHHLNTNNVKAMIDHAHIPILHLDENGIVLYANISAQHLFEMPGELIEGKPLSDLHEKGAEAQLATAFRELSEKGFVRIRNINLMKGNGDRMLADVTAGKIDLGDYRIFQALFYCADSENTSHGTMQSIGMAQSVLLETMNAHVWHLADAETYGYVNRAHAEFIGKSAEEAAGRKLHELFEENVANVCLESNLRVFLERAEIKTEEWVPDCSGEKRLLAIFKTPHFDEEGQIERIVCVANDITEQKRAESTLRIQNGIASSINDSTNLEEALEAILDSLLLMDSFDAGGFYVYDKGRDCLQIKASRGLSDRFIKAASCYEMNSPAVRKLYSGELLFGDYGEIAKDRGEPFASEGLRAFAVVPFLYKGKLLAALNIASHLNDEISMHDIFILQTVSMQLGSLIYKMKADIAIRESEARYRNLFDMSPCGVALVSKSGVIVECNETASAILGMPANEIMGKSLHSLSAFSKEDKQSFEKYLTDSFQRGNAIAFEKSLFINGQEYCLEFISSIICESENEPALLIMTHDLTERVNTEREREAREEHLKNFIDIASHELRHPMSVIKGFSELLFDEKYDLPDEKRREALDEIRTGVNRLERIVNDLLRTANIENDRFRIVKKEVDVCQIIEHSIRDIEPIYPEVRFFFRRKSGAVLHSLDPQKFFELMKIMLENAVVHAAASGEVEIEAEKSNRHIAIAVTDSGPGIPPEKTDLIFEKFYQVEKARFHSKPGLGLGLYFAKEIVTRHGGSIWCEPRKGGGSIFKCIIP